MIPRCEGRDAIGREWRNKEPWSGVFEMPLDAKGNFVVRKFVDGVEVEPTDAERERYLANRIPPPRFVTWGEQLRRKNPVGQVPRALDLVKQHADDKE